MIGIVLCKFGILLWQPLADAEGAKKFNMMELLKAHGGLSYVSPITNASLNCLMYLCFMMSQLCLPGFPFYCCRKLWSLNEIVHAAGSKWKSLWTKACPSPSAEQVWLGNWTFWVGLLKLCNYREGEARFYFGTSIWKLVSNDICRASSKLIFFAGGFMLLVCGLHLMCHTSSWCICSFYIYLKYSLLLIITDVGRGLSVRF